MSTESIDMFYCWCKSILETLTHFRGGAIGEFIRQIRNTATQERSDGECGVCHISEELDAENTPPVESQR
jgi:hypothetical protein